MSDVQWLFLILALLYASECLFWVPSGAIAFAQGFGRSWTRSHPWLSNHRGGFVLAPWFSPLGSIVICHAPVAIVEPDGIIPRHARGPENTGVVDFSSLADVQADGKNLAMAGKRLFKARSTVQAVLLCDQIRKLAALDRERRRLALEAGGEEQFRSDAIQQRLDDFQQRTGRLRILANILFLYLFAVAPAVIWRFGLLVSWRPLLVSLYVLTFATAFLFRRAHKHFYPRIETERFTYMLMQMFAPATAIRARDVLSRNLLEGYHPLAIAWMLLPANKFPALAREWLIDLTYSARDNAAASGLAGRSVSNDILAFDHNREQRIVLKFLKANGLSPEQLLAPPARMDTECLSYCPRCRAQFRIKQGVCSDCGGLQLISFPA